jgi:hypothetical protein
MTSSGSWSYSHNNHVSLLSSSQQTALPLPKSVKGNRSFANLAKLFGINSSYRNDHSETEEDEEEEVLDPEDAVDEDSLMWDAQVGPLSRLRHPKHTHTHNTGTNRHGMVTRPSTCYDRISQGSY